MKTFLRLVPLFKFAVSLVVFVALWQVDRMSHRLDAITKGQADGFVPFPSRIVFNKSDLYAPCIGVGDGTRKNIMWRERTAALAAALNSPGVRKAIVEVYGKSDFHQVTDLKFRPEQHHPHTLEVVEGNQIWWREEVAMLIPVLNSALVQAALAEALREVSVRLPEMPIETT